MVEPLRLEVWSDVACPWCWIGHARLARALQAEPPDSVQVIPRAFELQPQLPPEGVPAAAFLTAKFGSVDRVRQVFSAMAAEGEEVGLNFRFDRMQRAPNTRLAHRLVAIAADEGRAGEVLDALFAAHFREGADVADPAAAVAAVARATGLDAERLRLGLDAGVGAPEVTADEQRAADLGIAGVPYFLAGGVVAMTGAQPPEHLGQLLAAARERLAA